LVNKNKTGMAVAMPVSFIGRGRDKMETKPKMGVLIEAHVDFRLLNNGSISR